MRVNFGGAAGDAEAQRGGISPGCSEVACGPLCHADAPEGSDSPRGGTRGQLDSSLWKLTPVKSNRTHDTSRKPTGTVERVSAAHAARTPYRGPKARTLSVGACGKVDVDGPAESYMSVARNMSKGCPPSGS